MLTIQLSQAAECFSSFLRCHILPSKLFRRVFVAASAHEAAEKPAPEFIAQNSKSRNWISSRNQTETCSTYTLTLSLNSPDKWATFEAWWWRLHDLDGAHGDTERNQKHILQNLTLPRSRYHHIQSLLTLEEYQVKCWFKICQLSNTCYLQGLNFQTNEGKLEWWPLGCLRWPFSVTEKD